MKKITELKNLDNISKINSMTAEEKYQWYLRIKESLPLLKKTRDTSELEKAIKDYEHRNGIL
jgi:hypothetical protein